jgi:hypothetical protein
MRKKKKRNLKSLGRNPVAKHKDPQNLKLNFIPLGLG